MDCSEPPGSLGLAGGTGTLGGRGFRIRRRAERATGPATLVCSGTNRNHRLGRHARPRAPPGRECLRLAYVGLLRPALHPHGTRRSRNASTPTRRPQRRTGPSRWCVGGDGDGGRPRGGSWLDGPRRPTAADTLTSPQKTRRWGTSTTTRTHKSRGPARVEARRTGRAPALLSATLCEPPTYRLGGKV